MQLLKGKCATARRFMAFILFTFFAAGMALGQLAPSLRFNIPYAFTVGSKALPAGTYTFSMSPDLSNITVASVTGRQTEMVKIISSMSGPNELFEGGYLVFDKTNEGLILSEVWLSGTYGALLHPIPNGHFRLGLIGTSLSTSRPYLHSGKTTYDLTCARCHGGSGKGSPEADKFFGLTIPRLDSAEVQSMSDAQLRQQITEGSSAMPPVEIDESGFRHRLPPLEVDAVISYVRTLKR